MLIEKRKALHEKTAQAIEALYAERLDDHIGDLAHHYGRSANNWQAVKYLNLAGQQAVQRQPPLPLKPKRREKECES